MIYRWRRDSVVVGSSEGQWFKARFVGLFIAVLFS